MEGYVQGGDIGKSQRECINVRDEKTGDAKKLIKSIKKE